MSMKRMVRESVKRVCYATPVVKNYLYGMKLYRKFRRSTQCAGLPRFLLGEGRHLYYCRAQESKAEQIAGLLRKVDIQPVDNDRFFYSLDCFKMLENRKTVYGNCTADIDMLVQGALREEESPADSFGRERNTLLRAMRSYLGRCHWTPGVGERYEKQIAAASSLFERPAESFFEALQRILFYNQFLWQTGHTLNGLGHLDWVLEQLYQRDIAAGILTRESAKELLKDFFRVLHECYWFKSEVLMGDTGQIVILGGRTPDGGYRCNELTYLFIEVSEELCMPDPKVLLRCTADMLEDLLEAAVGCIATGIGAPLLSNDDEIIPAMLSCGFDEADVYDYGVSACWEPLIPGLSFEPNNIASLNYAEPFVRMAELPAFDAAGSTEEVISLYETSLNAYIKERLTPLSTKEFEEDPLLSLLSPSCIKNRKDITRGGAKYNNMGLTSVGLGTVVNSILNLDRLVFSERRFDLGKLNAARKENFAGEDSLVGELKGLSPAFGSDDGAVVALTKRLIAFTSAEFEKYKTPYGGVFKFGLSSPSYISDADKVSATFDGRRDGEPFSVHISSASAIPTTELLSFAMQMDYNGNRLNGNVIDFITSPGMLTKNIQKYAALLRAGFAGGIFQLQMNVVDSKTLIAAKADPTLFPDLVVRVWGFSAYFNDLPEEYKDVLISRAIESEKAA